MNIASYGVQFDTGDVKRGGDEFVDTMQRVRDAALGTVDPSNKASEAIRTVEQSLLAVGAAFAVHAGAEYSQQVVELADRYEELGIVLTRVGKNVGESQAQLEDLRRSLMATGISAIESRQSILSMIQAQLDLSKATQLARVAQDAAVIGQLNSSEAYQRLIAGVVTGRVEILRTMGIQANWAAAYEQLATATGVTVTQLTEQEKVQARMNAVLAAGVNITGAYETAMENAGKQMRSSVRYVEDLKVGIGEVFQPQYTAAVFTYVGALDFLKEHMALTQTVAAALMGAVTGLAAVLALFGAGLAVAKAVEVFKTGLATLTTIVNALSGAEVAATAVTITLGEALSAISVIGAVIGVIGGIVAVLGYFGVGASAASKAAKDLGDAMAEVDEKTKLFSQHLKEVSPVTIEFKTKDDDKVEKAIRDTTAALRDQNLANDSGFFGELTKEAQAFDDQLVGLKNQLVAGTLPLVDYEKQLTQLGEAYPYPETEKLIVEADKLGREFVTASGKTDDLKTANDALAKAMGTTTDVITGQTTAILSFKQAADGILNMPSKTMPGPGPGSPLLTPVADVGNTGAEATQAEANTKRLKDALAEGGQALMKHVQDEIKANEDAAKSWKEHSGTTVDFAQALKSLDKPTRRMAENLFANTLTIVEQDRAQKALESSTTKGTQAASARAGVEEALQKVTVESLKSQGDLVAAAQKELDVETITITAKYAKLVAEKLLSASYAERGRLAEIDIAKMQEEATVTAALAKKKAELASAYTELASTAMQDEIAQAKLDGDTARATALAFDAQRQSIIDTTNAKIAAINASNDHTTAEKVWLDIMAIVHEKLQLHGVDLAETAAAQEKMKALTTDVATAESEYYIALLKFSGDTKAAKQAELELKEKLWEATIRLRAAEIGTQDAVVMADRLIALHRETTAVEDLTVQYGTHVNKVKDLYKQLGEDIQRTLRSTFENMFTNGLASFSDLFTEIKKLFLKMLADMAAAEIEADLGKLLFGKGGGGTSIGGTSTSLPIDKVGDATAGQSKFGNVGGKVVAGVEGIAIGAATGNPLEGAIGGAAAGAQFGPWGAAIGAVGGAIAGFVSGLFGQADRAKKAAEALALEEQAWDLTLRSYIDSTSTAVSQLQKDLDAADANRKGVQDKAAQTFGMAPQDAARFAAMTKEQLAASESAYKLTLAEGGLSEGQREGDLATIKYLEALQQVPSAAEVAAEAIKKFTKSIDDAYTASLPGGQNQLTIQGFADTRDANLKSLQAPGLSLSSDDENRLTKEINDTFTNSIDNFLKGLSQSDLETLIPTLTGDTLAYAQALDAALKATQESTDLARNATAQGGLYGRLSTAEAATNPAQAALDAAKARAQQESDEIAAATKIMTDDLAAHASDAVIANDKFTISLIQTTQAAEDAATAAAKLAADQRTSTNLNLDLMQRNAKLSGDPEQLRLSNLAILQDAQGTELANAKSLLDAGTITKAQYDHVVGTLKNEMTSAIASFDGTVGGVTKAVHDLAVAAQILQDNTSQLSQQWQVFGTDIHEQVKELGDLYGFTGKTDDELRKLYTKMVPGQELTDAQKNLNSEIQNYLQLEGQAVASDAAAAQAGTGTAAGSAAPTGTVVTGDLNVSIVINTTSKDLANPDKLATAIAQRVSRELGGQLALQKRARGITFTI